jgi:hypothetical protein
MDTTSYTVPENPADPEAAALELIVRFPINLLDDDDGPSLEALQEFAGFLSAEGTFAGMSWHDARHAAAAIVFDVTNRRDAGEFLRHRAEAIVTGAVTGTWDDRDAMIRAFTSAAAVFELEL